MGPRAGLSEITLPAVQPGSSIMPGKVNPSVPEMVNQVCFQVIGCDTTIALACEAGQLELNVMMPVMAWNALHAATILRQAMRVLRTRTVDGITANEGRARELLDRSTAAATALSPHIGYAATAEIAKESVRTGKSIRDLVLDRGLLDAATLDAILSVDAMTRAAFLVDGLRSPFGRYGGGLAGVRADDLLAQVIAALVAKTKVPTDKIDEVILGHGYPSGEEPAIGRLCALKAGLPQVGVLVSKKYASLHPGYYVVFSGVYDNFADAQTAATAASGKFPSAYARQITR